MLAARPRKPKWMRDSRDELKEEGGKSNIERLVTVAAQEAEP